MRIAAEVARSKELHPERFCPVPRCLWRTGGGFCPRHQREAPIVNPKLKTNVTDDVLEAQSHLERVTRRAHEDKLVALEAYLATGGTYGELGRLLGVSRQAVRQYVERGRKS